MGDSIHVTKDGSVMEFEPDAKIHIAKDVVRQLYAQAFPRRKRPTAVQLSTWASAPGRRHLFPAGLTVEQAQDCLDNPGELWVKEKG